MASGGSLERVLPSFALAMALLLTALPIVPPAEASHFSPIQPGARIYPSRCTFNVVWSDASGALYIGAAAHCVSLGQRVSGVDVGEIGTVVYDNGTSGDSRPWMDYALIRIDEDKYDLVDPALRFWGGPTGIQDTFVPGTPVLQYGHGLVISYTEFTRPREGVLETVFGYDGFGNEGRLEGWYLASFPALGGDSGSLVLTADGKALGVAIGLAPTWGQPGIVNGPTFLLIQEVLAMDGFDLELVTSPLAGTDPASHAEEEALHALEECTTRIIDRDREDYCVNTGRTDIDKPDPEMPPPGSPGAVLWQGDILWGGPYTYTIPVTGYIRLGCVVPGTDSRCTGDVLPPAGSYVMTETTTPGGLPYDVDVYLWPGGTRCATTAPDEVCGVTEGARYAQITGYYGLAMNVTLREYVLDT